MVERSIPEPIAVVGSSCRLPGGSSTPSKLWSLLKEPRDLLSEVPMSRFNVKSFYHPDGEHHGATNATHAYFLDESEDVRTFDYNFFNINPREAEAIDPQQRMLLETVYEGMEACGYSVPSLQGSDTCVFVGQSSDDYTAMLQRDLETIPHYFATGVARSIMSNRLSYFFDWKGASVCLDTACSSSLIALHLGIQELRNGTSKLAVAAGVNLILGPEVYIMESKLHMLSPTGRSRMWDANADGYARGEGCVAVFLKTLSQALADGDHIECIVRETGMNQDGHTPGLTMPNPAAQSDLIRATYARAGLDVTRKEDRCQFFEAHGTGTKAGDPVEAEAVYNAFFTYAATKDDIVFSDHADGSERLYVGSIKTVLGHLESGAGLAGFLRASLAVQNGVIPPNMHFGTLNPKIERFYHRLCVPTEALPWPALPDGVPRRASLNSFGFGGSNAHAIIESWDGAPENKETRPDTHLDTRLGTRQDSPHGNTLTVPHGPFVLSANSQAALVAAAVGLSDYLDKQETESPASSSSSSSLADLAWTLQNKRTEFAYRAYASGTTRAEIRASLAAGLKAVQNAKDASLNTNPFVTEALPVTAELPPRILGVFTGQGAQWPTMGAELYKHSALFRRSLEQLEASLAQLPVEADRPAWSLTAELLKPAETSRIREAAIAQPLCTALQIALVDLLRAAGIAFHGVVGHSSGEIAAAYAVDYLSAADAIRIAYYRGVHATKARDGPQPGKMMAVGMPYEDAVAFCGTGTPFAGRIVAAASNSRSSTTLSGDADAIDEAEAKLKADGVFARVLQVDTAYHSHHMQRCSAAYLASLRQCGIAVRAPPVAPDAGFVWFSSVHGTGGRSIYEPDTLRDTYWVDNMAQPVLFAQALDRAATESHCFDLVLEVGPHPALKGPASEVLRTVTGVDLPYTGVLSRGSNDLAAFSSALGFVWSHFQSPATVVDFEAFRRACVGDADADVDPPRLVKDLPGYAWDHDVPLWKESIVSKKYRLREDPPHELLGWMTASGNGHEIRWRNVMKINELEWLRGHVFQNQILFPAAGYVSMAVEAAVHLVKKQSALAEAERGVVAQIVELQDLHFHAAITIDPDAAGTEVVFTIRVVEQEAAGKLIAEVSCYSGSVDGTTTDAEKVNFTGRAIVTLGTADGADGAAYATALPARVPPVLPMADVDVARFYNELEKIGLRYSGDFVVASAQRRLGLATAVIKRPATNAALYVHPATLDAAFQGVMAAFCFPGDGRMWTSYLPTGIRTVRVNIAAARVRMQEFAADPSNPSNVSQAVADCFLSDATSKVIAGDLDLFNARDSRLCEVQITGLACSSFTKPGPQNDRKTFSKMVWRPQVASGMSPEDQPAIPDGLFDAITALDRTSVYFLRRLVEQVSEAEFAAAEWQFQSVLRWAKDYLLPKIDSGQHRRLTPATANDTPEMVAGWLEKYGGDSVDMELAWAVGSNLPAMVRGEVPVLQVLMENDRLNRLYRDGVGLDLVYSQFNALIRQMNHEHPGLRVLEIGAGTGGASVGAVKAVSPHFASYTYTDISPAFFEKAKARFTPDELAKMEFRVLDIERDPLEQGFDAEGYDLILASNVLHATRSLASTLANCRKITKPGGRMIVIEITGDAVYTSFIMSGLPGWWLGKDDGRIYGPLASEARWDELMQGAGFSGVDVSCSDLDDFYGLVMTTQAVDDRIALLREPLAVGTWDRAPAAVTASAVSSLVVVGGQTLAVNRVTQTIRRLLRPLGVNVVLVPDIADIVHVELANAAVLCLADLDEPMFKNMAEAKFKGMQTMILASAALLWVTKNRRTAEPYSNMAVGMARVIAFESPHLVMQFLDVDSFVGGLGRQGTAEATLFAEALLRLVYLSSPDFADVFWVRETEMCIEDGRVLVPRIIADDELNDRLNADRRPILKTLQLDAPDSNVIIVQEAGSRMHILEAEPLHLTASTNSAAIAADSHRIKLQASSLYPLRTRDGKALFVGIGADLDDNSKLVLVTSSENGSVVHVAPGSIIGTLDKSHDNHDNNNNNNAPEVVLQQLLVEALAESLTSDTVGTLWVNGGCTALVDRVVSKAKDKALALVATSTAPEDRCHAAQTAIYRYDNERRVLGLLPKGDLTFTNLDLAAEADVISRIVRNDSNLAAETSVDARPLFRATQAGKAAALSLSSAELAAVLARAHVRSASLVATAALADGIISIENVADLPMGSLPPTQVVRWSTPNPVVAQVFPTTSADLFKSDKTYFLVGLTGALGLSICGWMADHGARHIAIASRHANVDPHVLDDFRRRGATDVRVYALDVADKENLLAVHARIRAEMPPIAGVANAAMVLRDKPFNNCTLDDFTYVFGPKVDGSRYLDELFSTPGELDFFVFFSSLACIIGNKAQSNYSAANMYMHTLATQRRQRGLPAAVIDIAMLLGVGYVDRALSTYEARLVGMYGYIGLYESEMHNIFASAILAGHPNSAVAHSRHHSPQIMTGVPLNAAARFPTKPLFAHIRQADDEQATAATARGAGKAELSTRVLGQLAEAAAARGPEATLATLEAAFSRKVELILQLPADKIESKVPLIKLGLDSLVAVELRSWFLKELNIDMAVLKFLSGSSIADICRDALGQLASLSSAAASSSSSLSLSSSTASVSVSAPLPSPHMRTPSSSTTGGE
ncbi:Type I Iterative PKS [Sporothrix curviconia]|uniref:Type I Iterative PKS n=1 Tax=Sporothrix curviconia TaxID=1260050 RepID=A0ABP0BDB2_9PEZI